MPYQVTCEPGTSTTILRAIDEVTNDHGDLVGYVHESPVYTRGAIIDEEDISPVVLSLLKDGNPLDRRNGDAVRNIRRLLKYVEPSDAKKLATGPREEEYISPVIEDDPDNSPLADQVERNPIKGRNRAPGRATVITE